MSTNVNEKKVAKKVTKTTTKKVVKKVTKAAPKKITMTLSQANTIVSALSKAGKSYKFLNVKVSALQ